MRKKKLIADNEILLERLNTAEGIIAELKSKLAKSETQIEFLNNTVNLLKSNRNADEVEDEDNSAKKTEPETPLDDGGNYISEEQKLTDDINNESEATENSNNSDTACEPCENETDVQIHSIFSTELPEFTSVIDYSSKIIGKLIVESTKVNCVLAAKRNESKELISLTLGKAEVTKAEILKIISGSETPEEKKAQIDKKYFDCLSYFSNIIG